jgi:hypothetical protein
MTVVFTCLLVENAGQPLGDPFVLRKREDEFFSELADTIKERRTDILAEAPQIV